MDKLKSDKARMETGLSLATASLDLHWPIYLPNWDLDPEPRDSVWGRVGIEISGEM